MPLRMRRFGFAALLLCATLPRAFAQSDDLFTASSESNISGQVFRVNAFGNISTVATGLPSFCLGCAFDAKGDLYVADFYGGTISKVNKSGAASTFVTGLDHPNQLAFNAHGDLFVTSFNSGNILKVTSTGVVSTYFSGLNHPSGLAFDSAGNLFVAQEPRGGSLIGAIQKIARDGTVTAFADIFANGIGEPGGLAFDSAGELYAVDQLGSAIVRVNKAGVVQTFATGIPQPVDLAFDAHGDLYVSSPQTDSIYKVTKAGVVSLFVKGLHQPIGLAFNYFLPEGRKQEAPTLNANPLNSALMLALATPAIILIIAVLLWLIFRKKDANE